MISHLIKPLVLTGMYKNEDVALKDIIITHIKKKIEAYKKTIRFFERKYKKILMHLQRILEIRQLLNWKMTGWSGREL